jgi:Mrp family chromosome partitioning ATPase
MSGTDLQRSVRSSADTESRLIEVLVKHEDPAVAARVANEVVAQLNAAIEGEPSTPAGVATLAEPAQPPLIPIAPQVNLIVAMAALAGLLAAVLIVVVAEAAIDGVRDSAEVASVSGLPVLATVSRLRPETANGHIGNSGAQAPAYQLLVAALGTRMDDGVPRCVLIAGCQRNDGSAGIALSVAQAIGNGGRQVILVDGNSVDRDLTLGFASPDRTGINDLLDGSPAAVHSPLRILPGGVRFMPAGRSAANGPSSQARAQEVLDGLLLQADTIVIHGAPPQEAPDSLMWAAVAGATIVVAERVATRRSNLRLAVEALTRVGARVVGAVVVEQRRPNRSVDAGNFADAAAARGEVPETWTP